MGTIERAIIAAAAVAALAGSTQAQAQSRFSVEVRGGAAVPTQQLGAQDLKTASTVEFTAAYRIVQPVSIYAGWDWFRAPLEKKMGDIEDADATGYAFGVRLDGPAVGTVTPWVRAGGLYNHVELEGDTTDARISSKHKLGWEVGAGVSMPIKGRWSLTPGVRYRSFSPVLDQLGPDPRLSYLTFEVGFAAAIGGK